MSVQILIGDCRDKLRELPDASVHCCVTSPPYFGLRDYGVEGQMGLEPTPDEFVAGMVEVFREVRRALRDDGTLWLNIGDSYARSASKGGSGPNGKNESRWGYGDAQSAKAGSSDGQVGRDRPGSRASADGIKEKDLLGIPWMLAFALRADGWYLRQDIIWSKPNPMPESVRDRCTKAHEYIFMFSKRPKYFYDAEAIRNPPSEAMLQQVRDGYGGSDTKDYAAVGAQSASGTKARIIENARKKVDKQRGHGRRYAGFNDRWDAMERAQQLALGSNKRSVWEVATQPFSEAHFATYPPALIEPCILAGCPARCCSKCGAAWESELESGCASKRAGDDVYTGQAYTSPQSAPRGPKRNFGVGRKVIAIRPRCACAAGTVAGTVLDPFGGAGTTGLVADRLGRNAILAELNPEYAAIARRRLEDDAGMFAQVAAE